jgi:hypothetical protein
MQAVGMDCEGFFGFKVPIRDSLLSSDEVREIYLQPLTNERLSMVSPLITHAAS